MLYVRVYVELYQWLGDYEKNTKTLKLNFNFLKLFLNLPTIISNDK